MYLGIIESTKKHQSSNLSLVDTLNILEQMEYSVNEVSTSAIQQYSTINSNFFLHILTFFSGYLTIKMHINPVFNSNVIIYLFIYLFSRGKMHVQTTQVRTRRPVDNRQRATSTALRNRHTINRNRPSPSLASKT